MTTEIAKIELACSRYELLRPLGEGGVGAVYLVKFYELEHTADAWFLTLALPEQAHEQ